MKVTHFGPSEIGTRSLRHLLSTARATGLIAATDGVWRHPDGSLAVTASVSALNDPEYADYTDAGTVDDYTEVDTTEEMVLSDPDRRELKRSGMSEAYVQSVKFDRHGYPDRLLIATVDGLDTFRGWWYHGESVSDIKWREI